jgi:preprotein translocase subunit SecF
MQFIKPDIDIDFIRIKKLTYTLSTVLILISVASLIIHKGPHYGIDFVGGTEIQVKFNGNVTIEDIRSGLAGINLAKFSVQQFGEKAANEYLIRTDNSVVTDQAFSKLLAEGLRTNTGTDAEIRRVEMVGPQVGEDLREKALLAIFFSMLMISIYISGRFEFKWMVSLIVAAALFGAVYLLRLFDIGGILLIGLAFIISLVIFWFLELKYALGATVALLHDVVITVGIFSILGKEFTLPIIAALLTIIGYSLNDTIIVFDRIRENLKKYHKNPMTVIINRSVNETLVRTILTSGTTLAVVLALFFLGGSIIHDFAFALIVGVAVGTYSSIYVASPLLLAWQGRK